MRTCLSVMMVAGAVAVGPEGLARADAGSATSIQGTTSARTPTIESMWMRSYERMTLAFDGAGAGSAVMQEDDRGMLSGGLAVGLAYPVTRWQWRELGGLHGHTRVGAGLLFTRGDVPVGVEQDLVFRLRVTRALSVSAGVSAGLRLVATDIDASRWELAVPIELRWRSLALVYRPGVSGALAGEERAVFAGEMTRQARPGIDLLYVAARVYISALGF